MEEVLTQTKFDILRTGLRPTALKISDALRAKASEIVNSSDFPKRKNEAWKYTNVNGLNKLVFDGKNAPISEPLIISNRSRKLFVKNGQVSEGQSVLSGIKTSGDVLPEFYTDDAFDALNVLYCTAAIQLNFDNAENETIELVFENTTNSAIFPRLFIQCNKGAKGTVILNFQGAEKNASFINVSTYVNVGENANLSIHKIQKKRNRDL